MNKMFLLIGLLCLGACSLFEKKEDEVVDNKPLPNCVQQVEPKNPAIPCKIGDWFAEGHASCSSTKEKCLKK
jgi:hypothetical protein